PPCTALFPYTTLFRSVIEAMPAIVEKHPDTVYRIVGATHPNLLAHEGEAYRERLQACAERLGVSDHILWENRFLETDELLDQLEDRKSTRLNSSHVKI